MKLKQLVAMAVVSGGLGLSAVGLGIGMAHAEPTEPTSPSPAPPTELTEPSMPPEPALPPGEDPYIGLPVIPQIPGTF
jgi:hypothetical protein